MISPLKFIRQDVQSMHAYAVQDSKGFIKLDAMENPFTLPAALQGQLGERLGKVAINRYPGTRIDDLKTALRAYAQVPADYGLMLGNGSDELISLLAMACDIPNAKILAPLPGFVMYAMSAQLQGLQFIGVDLTADFELDGAAMLAAIAKEKPVITYLAYPNNPTANLWDAGVIKQIIAACAAYGGMVVMDEAYQPFSSKSWMDEIKAAPAANANVLLMRTLSKFGLAGVRLGYMTGPQALIHEIDKLRPPYNISVLNAECALFALENSDAFSLQAQQICAQRAHLLGAIGQMPKLKAYPSDANMITVRTPDADAAFAHLKSQDILVKNISKMHPLLKNCIRLTVGTPDENTQMLSALRGI
ncbi:histidinol-phosphate transaminase [Variovorax sp. PCZ-1]|uniref:histidinol-phosphate transaminase n=1 Tax=Variovorax sp. PCZ-1 TaxID=2835533 RepID=UPI001BCBB4AE|nr:histidinol-phosphate transaminase [Variovorax sp. PCZ-1]MBS7806220.1 histidinol-phosphate transaminase [Variovorax sp. PCZ-1]